MDDDIGTTGLIQQLQAGDDKPLGELMTRYKPQIWPLILTKICAKLLYRFISTICR